MRVEAGAAERLGRLAERLPLRQSNTIGRSRSIAVDRRRQIREPTEPVAGDPARFVLLRLADVDQLASPRDISSAACCGV